MVTLLVWKQKVLDIALCEWLNTELYSTNREYAQELILGSFCRSGSGKGAAKILDAISLLGTLSRLFVAPTGLTVKQQYTKRILS